MQHKDGNHTYISIKFPLIDSADSVYAVAAISTNVYAVAAISTNISDRKRFESDLQESNEWLMALINVSPDIICCKDGEGRWLQANEADLRLFQLTGVDYKGKTDAELAPYSGFYREVFLACMESDEEAWRQGAPSEGEEIIPIPDGEEKIYKIIKVPIFYPDGMRKGHSRQAKAHTLEIFSVAFTLR